MIRARSQLSILLILPSLAALSVAGESDLVGAWRFASDASFTGGIQEAIDSLPRCGGVVQLPPGTYPLRRPGTSDRNLVTGNHCRGNLHAGVRLTGKNSSGTGNME